MTQEFESLCRRERKGEKEGEIATVSLSFFQLRWKYGPSEYMVSKSVHGTFKRYYLSAEKPIESLELWRQSGNDEELEVEKDLELSLPRKQPSEKSTTQDKVKEVFRYQYDYDSDEDPEDMKGIEAEFEDDNDQQITAESFVDLGEFEKEQRQIIEQEEAEDIITIIIDKIGEVSFEICEEMNVIATDSENQKSGNSLQHKAEIRDTLLRNYIEPIPTRMIDPNTILEAY